MAAVLNFDRTEAPSRHDADQGISTLLAHLESLPARQAVPLIGRYRAQLDSAEARFLASVIDATGSTKVAESIAAKGKVSRRARKRSAKRAAAVKKNGALADKMASGDLSAEHVDVLADAADKTDGASLTDESLIDSVANSNPDLGKSIIDDYLRDKDGAAGEQSRHDKQRSKRRVSRFRTKDDCEAIMIAGDKATIDRIWNETTRASNALYERDGGRDLRSATHSRTHDQRMFDAITGALSREDDAESTSDQTSKSRPAKRQTSSRRTTKRSRPTVVVTATLDKVSGLDPAQAAELIGSGPIADSVLAEYLGADPDIVGAIFGTQGELLWLGRRQRLASQGQFLGLVIRDKHCVLCGASHVRCRAHHTQPWNAPEPGTTDIAKLVLLCDSCHRFIHDQEQTIYKDRRSGEWKLRDALPHEIPPTRPPDPAKGQGPMRT